ncbi:phosphonoacetaldehyde hydrolase [Neorhodopirellula lusitana]|uniref:Phosphonoacetaldehyde hydrolase n=1 Tax=Neorhodopirellula lusitana TaxID=445327 RepID=A0ABY1QRN7_9BACT|nr:phosphonoacetaldehyde hydrolase [Neorhodopirellula lusitana]SMP75861.1 phosphonoacetaldehyde hydrolase [Neorhodopirellula lusitana]
MANSHIKTRLVVFDWAGTTIDFGSRAPAAAFAEVFAANGVSVTDSEARGPMGLNKREHLIAMLNDPSIAERWEKRYGRSWTEEDVDRMYDSFVPVQLEAIQRHAGLVPGLLDVVKELRQQGIKIVGTTGYFDAAAHAVLQSACQAGYVPDANICADDVPQGRPAPWMIYRAMEATGVFPASSVIKVGDTVADIQAGVAAGCWSIGVCDSSSLVGLSERQFQSLSTAEQIDRVDQAAEAFRSAGAHATIRSLCDLPGLIQRISNATTAEPHVLDGRAVLA